MILPLSAWRIFKALLFSIPAAAFAASLAMSGIMIFFPEWPLTADGPIDWLTRFVGALLLMAVLGSIFISPFTIAFALLSQLPLLLAESRLGIRSKAMHVLLSMALGIAAIPLMPVVFGRGPWFGEADFRLYSLGAGGGLGVGLVWTVIFFRSKVADE